MAVDQGDLKFRPFEQDMRLRVLTAQKPLPRIKEERFALFLAKTPEKSSG
jgi:hypothetical protein